MNSVAYPANALAYLALFGWPLVVGVLFARLPFERAAVWSVLGGYLLLPSGFKVDPPLLPAIDKSSVPVLSTLFFCFAKGVARKHNPIGIWLPLFAAIYVLAPTAATFGNSYELKIGSLSLPGFYLLDGIKGSINNLIQVSAFYLAARFLSSPTGRLEIAKAFVIGMVAYSLPMLVEVRLSPQIHRWVYGFSPFSVAQQMRAGGFRPVVFLPQGLQLALFVAMALLAACILARARVRIIRVSAAVWAAYLVPILLLCKTLGAFAYGLALAPFAIFAKPKTCVNLAIVVMLFICTYPALRSQDLVPIQSIVRLAESLSEDRAASLMVRVTNEDILMQKANQKPLFGWGGWGRNGVFDATLSKDVSITDGGWIGYFGAFGWFGYLGLFGMLTAALFRLRTYVKRADQQDAMIAGGLALLLAANMADMLPNANLTPITFLIAGAITRKAVGAVLRRSAVRGTAVNSAFEPVGQTAPNL